MKGEGIRIEAEAEYPRELTDRFELLECFAESEEARTLLAREKKTGYLAVVKCYLRGNPLYERSEPEALRTLAASPLPRFLGEYSNELMRCSLREYISGTTLASQKDRTFREEEIISVGEKLCDQLTALHSRKPPIIHRDIKPQNVVLRGDGEPVLIDFGISRLQSGGRSDTFISGTDGYMPPEQYGYAQTDARSDIYALGVLLQWMRTKDTELPEKPETPLERVIARCTAFSPEDRYSTAEQVKKDLRAARRGRGGRSLTVRRILIAAVCVIAALLVGFEGSRLLAPRPAALTEPLIAEAARLSLGLSDHEVLTEERLAEVRAVYIVADQAYADQDRFYPAINAWYAAGKEPWGTLRSLEDLSRMPNLEQVCIVAEEIEDISALSGLRDLNKAEFKHNRIMDISPLAGLKVLSSVGINDNPVRDISPLRDCPALAFLDLCDVRTYDTETISDLGNFDFLDLSNPTDSWRYLAGKSILALRLSWTGITDLSVLDEVTRLEDLQIGHTAVSDLSPLRKHPGLKTLNIAGIPAKDLSVLSELPELREVVISEDMREAAEALGTVPFEIRIE